VKKALLLLTLIFGLSQAHVTLAQVPIESELREETYNTCSQNYSCTCVFPPPATGLKSDDQLNAEACNTHCTANYQYTYGADAPLEGGSWTFQCDNYNGVTINNASGPLGTGLEAAPPALQTREPLFPKLNIPIPGLCDGDICWQNVQNEIDPTTGRLQSNLLGEYIKAVYTYLLLAGSLMAITMLMIAGLQYATARGDATQVSKAKQRMQNAIVGVILLLLAYNIAFLVNPATVTFEPLTMQGIDGVESFPPEGEDDNVSPRSDLNGVTTEIIGDHLIAPAGVTISPDVLAQLQIAVDDFSSRTGRNVVIASGTRDVNKQATLFYNNCLVNGGVCSVPTCNPAAGSSVIERNGSVFSLTGSLENERNPSVIINTLIENSEYGNCPHTSAIALDAWCDDKGGNYQHDPKCQQELIVSMTNNGFCRLASEPWHFELDSTKVSTSCSTSNNTIQYQTKSGIKTPGNNCQTWDFKQHKCVLEVPLQ
jgi:hypothetical protein